MAVGNDCYTPGAIAVGRKANDAQVTVRAYTEDDLESLRAMHAAQGFGYGFPDLSDPLFLVRTVVEEEGRPRMAAFLRLTAEAYLLADPREGSPRQRWRWLLALHEAVRHEAAALGWRRDPWTCYTRVL